MFGSSFSPPPFSPATLSARKSKSDEEEVREKSGSGGGRKEGMEGAPREGLSRGTGVAGTLTVLPFVLPFTRVFVARGLHVAPQFSDDKVHYGG